nr:MAG TPA: Rho termination factor, N-terminal domain [Caudoviricetes sp.]
MTRAGLLEMAAGMGLTGLSAAKKADIIMAIEAVM